MGATLFARHAPRFYSALYTQSSQRKALLAEEEEEAEEETALTAEGAEGAEAEK